MGRRIKFLTSNHSLFMHLEIIWSFSMQVGNMSKKWQLKREDDIKEKPIVKELTKVLGVRASD